MIELSDAVSFAELCILNFWGDTTIRKSLLLALVLPGLLLAARAQAPLSPGDADAVIRRIDNHYNHLVSLEAHYAERYTGMGMDRMETGILLLKKPGRMRWSYNTPAGKVFILDGKDGWFYTPGDAQAQRVSARQLDDLRSPLRFLLGHTQLKKELDGVSVHTTSDGYTITGVPKGMAQRVKLLTLVVDQNALITSMQLEEVDGAVTAFNFSAMRENLAVANSTFVFTPPAGVTVVNGLPPI